MNFIDFSACAIISLPSSRQSVEYANLGVPVSPPSDDINLDLNVCRSPALNLSPFAVADLGEANERFGNCGSNSHPHGGGAPEYICLFIRLPLAPQTSALRIPHQANNHAHLSAIQATKPPTNSD